MGKSKSAYPVICTWGHVGCNIPAAEEKNILAGRALLAENKPRIVELFLEHKQFAMAPDGATTVTRAISLAHSLHPDYVLFTNDSASAFQKFLAPPLSAAFSTISPHGPIL